MVSTTTAPKILPTCIAMVAVWAQAPAPPSRSSQFHLHPPPPHLVPPVHGHVPPQLCYQTTLPTVPWAPWSLHHESPAGRFVPSPGCWWSFPPPSSFSDPRIRCLLTCLSLKDWAKPGPYDQPMVNTLRRKKDKEPAAAPDMNGSVNESSPAMTLTQAPPVLHSSLSVEERNKALIPPVKVRLYLGSNQICLISVLRTLMLLLFKPFAEKTFKEFVVVLLLQAGHIEPHEELALALTRGLDLDNQRSSRDSIQCSSGYSTQTNTPCCSEDTIPSQGIPEALTSPPWSFFFTLWSDSWCIFPLFF